MLIIDNYRNIRYLIGISKLLCDIEVHYPYYLHTFMKVTVQLQLVFY